MRPNGVIVLSLGLFQRQSAILRVSDHLRLQIPQTASDSENRLTS